MGRLTNAVFICVIVMVICIELIFEKKWKELLRCAQLFVLGTTVAVLPFVIYYAANGALKSMIDAAFLFRIQAGLLLLVALIQRKLLRQSLES